jgi:hypothetical protein
MQHYNQHVEYANNVDRTEQLLDTMPNMVVNLLDLPILNSFTPMGSCDAKMTLRQF